MSVLLKFDDRDNFMRVKTVKIICNEYKISLIRMAIRQKILRSLQLLYKMSVFLKKV